MATLRLLLAGLALMLAQAHGTARAQPAGEQPADTALGLPTLEQLVVTAPPLQRDPPQARQYSLTADRLDAVAAPSLADGLRLLPGVGLQTNSRGETLVFVRNAGERQLAVLFDGALLNVPWDNRLNLSLIPADGLGEVLLTSGPAAVRYGANTTGGVLELQPATPAAQGNGMRLRGQTGQAGFDEVSGAWLAQSGPLSLTVAGGYLDRRGDPLAGSNDSTIFGGLRGLRTNTDLDRWNAMLRLGLDGGPAGQLALTLLYVDAAYGIAPETSPLLANPRFWRYPDTHHLVGILSGQTALGSSTRLSGAVWLQDFGQTILSYASDRYEQLDDAQEDDDRTYGLRLILGQDIGQTRLSISLNGQLTRHIQVDGLPAADGAGPEQVFEDLQLFEDWRLSLGVEVERSISADVEAYIGISQDIQRPSATGGRPDSGDFEALNLAGGVRWEASTGLRYHLAAASKARLPTQRELYGTAINRFLVNPDLGSERVHLLEAGGQWSGSGLDFSATVFASWTDNTIDQRRVEVDGVSLRQRVNLSGSHARGLEVDGRWQLAAAWRLDGHVAVVRARQSDRDAPLGQRVLAERPDVLGRLDLTYGAEQGLELTAGIEHRGRAFSLADDGRFIPLPTATTVNALLAYNFVMGIPSGASARLFVRIDNLTDARIVPQLGLPAPGRWIRAGLQIGF